MFRRAGHDYDLDPFCVLLSRSSWRFNMAKRLVVVVVVVVSQGLWKLDNGAIWRRLAGGCVRSVFQRAARSSTKGTLPL